jgi:hypothetical protein
MAIGRAPALLGGRGGDPQPARPLRRAAPAVAEQRSGPSRLPRRPAASQARSLRARPPENARSLRGAADRVPGRAPPRLVRTPRAPSPPQADEGAGRQGAAARRGRARRGRRARRRTGADAGRGRRRCGRRRRHRARRAARAARWGRGPPPRGVRHDPGRRREGGRAAGRWACRSALCAACHASAAALQPPHKPQPRPSQPRLRRNAKLVAGILAVADMLAAVTRQGAASLCAAVERGAAACAEGARARRPGRAGGHDLHVDPQLLKRCARAALQRVQAPARSLPRGPEPPRPGCPARRVELRAPSPLRLALPTPSPMRAQAAGAGVDFLPPVARRRASGGRRGRGLQLAAGGGLQGTAPDGGALGGGCAGAQAGALGAGPAVRTARVAQVCRRALLAVPTRPHSPAPAHLPCRRAALQEQGAGAGAAALMPAGAGPGGGGGGGFSAGVLVRTLTLQEGELAALQAVLAALALAYAEVGPAARSPELPPLAARCLAEAPAAPAPALSAGAAAALTRSSCV